MQRIVASGISFEMGHRNIQFLGHVIDSETDQQGRHHVQTDPCVFYGSVANHPQHHSIVPVPAIQCNFNLHPVPGHNDGALVYGIPPYNGMQPQHPPANLDLAVAASSRHYNPYMGPLTGYFQNASHMEDFRLFKRKLAEGASSNHQYQNASAGPSFSVAPVCEPDISQMDSASFPPPEYLGTDPSSATENGSWRGARNRDALIRSEPALSHIASTIIHGNYVSPPVHFPGNPWLNMHFSATNGDIGTFGWTAQPPNFSYVHGGVNGACVEAGNIGLQGYQSTAINRTAAGFLHPPVARAHSSPTHPTPPMQAFRGNYSNYLSQVATSSHRTSTLNSLNAGVGPFREGVDGVPTFLAPIPPTVFRLHQPQQREIIMDPNARQRNHPHLRVLPEDEVAILEFHDYREAEASVDQHRDMRLDIDHMSYEELLELGEHIGSVGTGLTEEFIQNNMKARIFTTPNACVETEHANANCHDQGKINFCVVCQTDYESGATIGTLDCSHEYHRECITKWLVLKNTCPICKSTALNSKAKRL
ncbi:probable E3 ubiquitin-protein ligase ZFP1 isoform X2 [Andrographis paniculata]|uniref:probable E3 ubiquitin-protein ligase ZFP1 isoform X2 n=1 Tax=Andrographis paniculata TaxID=175694 RepID=UPI0021E94FF6|nr:probable E3 ubiquitin-protein ligase ZFP1 isoform X2 [Andrographis paniculata]